MRGSFSRPGGGDACPRRRSPGFQPGSRNHWPNCSSFWARSHCMCSVRHPPSSKHFCIPHCEFRTKPISLQTAMKKVA